MIAVLAAAAPPAVTAEAAPPACAVSQIRVFMSPTELPADIQATIRQTGGMAEPGAPIEPADNEPSRPNKRLVAASQMDCDIQVRFQRFDIDLFQGVLLARLIDGKWVVVQGSDYPFSRLARR